MFFTGDNDTRVDPLHARKMTALLQPASRSGRPILLHYSFSGGHSAGVGAEQQIQDDADELTVLWTDTEQPAVLKLHTLNSTGTRMMCAEVTSCPW